MERAQTKIDPGTVRLRNCWLERRWSNYMGCTVELLAAGGEDWGQGDSPEFRIELDGKAWSAKECGVEHWTEDCDPHCATVTAEYPAGEARIVIETRMFHEAPAWHKTLRVIHAGSKPLHIGRAAMEALALKPGWKIHPQQAQSALGCWHQESEADYVALRRADAGLLLGMPGGGSYAIFEPVQHCAVLYRKMDCSLPPGGSLSLPETFGVFFRSALDAVESREYADYRAALRQWRRYRATMARLLSGETGDGA